MADCPLPFDILPRQLVKHADAKAPVPLRMMGAKGLVPAVAPVDLVTLLFFLSFDEDAGVRETALKTAEGLPDKIYGVALRAEGIDGKVLDWLADRFIGKEGALELILLNAVTQDETVARLAPVASQKLGEIIRQNELRLLRTDGIIRGLCANPNALASTIDGACDFCVRNGMTLLDVPQLVAAHKRVHGVDPAVVAKPASETATGLLEEFKDELAVETAGDEAAVAAKVAEEEGQKLNLTQKVMRMSVSEKIKLATLGNKEARTILLRDSNKLVCMAAATSPRITDGEVLSMANSRTVNADVLRYIFSSREFLKVYTIKTSLVKNPKVPLPTALKLMFTLQEKDIKELARDRNVPATIQSQARAWVTKKEAASKKDPTAKH
jgi:hypothetical protein